MAKSELEKQQFWVGIWGLERTMVGYPLFLLELHPQAGRPVVRFRLQGSVLLTFSPWKIVAGWVWLNVQNKFQQISTIN